MSHSYEEFVKEICFVSKMQEQQNVEKQVHGERVTFPSDGTQLEAILYRSGKQNAVTIVSAFGGGFVMGGCALDDHMWTSLSRELGVNIVSIGYRKTPDYRFPVAVHDVYNGLCWFAEHAEDYGLCADRFAVMGASAGGNLAAGAAMLDRMSGTDHVRLQILNYPYLDLYTAPEKKGHPEDELNMYRLFPELYAAAELRKEPLVSPIYASDELKGLPPAYITVAGDDALRHEGALYAEKLKNAGVPVQCATAESMSHGYLEMWYNLTDDQRGEGEGFFPENMIELFKSGALEREAENTVGFIKKSLYDVFGQDR